MRRLTALSSAVLVAMLGLPSQAGAGSIVVASGIGGNAAALQPTVDAFRTLIGGGFIAGANGSFGGVRREINWDGVPDAFSAPNLLPANFFNLNSPRGVVFATPVGFQVSANAVNPTFTPIEFDNINATYSSIFQTFSAQRLFTALGSNITDVNFFVPGTGIPSSTRFFGAVFIDVDIPPGAGCTSIEAFNGATSLGAFCVQPLSNGLSFLGIQATGADVITRVRILSGNVALGLNDSPPTDDVAVMDDFIFQEVAVVPEPATLGLLTLGLGTLAAGVRRARGRRK